MVTIVPQAQLRAPVNRVPQTLADLGAAVQEFGLARQAAATKRNRKLALQDFAQVGDSSVFMQDVGRTTSISPLTLTAIGDALKEANKQPQRGSDVGDTHASPMASGSAGGTLTRSLWIEDIQ